MIEKKIILKSCWKIDMFILECFNTLLSAQQLATV